MKKHQIELVSALLDGQLTGLRRWLVQRHVNRCVVCSAEYRQQQRVRQLLAQNPPTAQMNESAEFFWSQVKRGIEAAGQKTVEIPAPRLRLGDWIGQHQYALASATAALVVIAAGVFWLTRLERGVTVAMVEGVSTDLPDAAATAYRTSDTGTSVIWISGLPWAEDISEVQSTLESEDI
jgi:anti-sigma factor RsiW